MIYSGFMKGAIAFAGTIAVLAGASEYVARQHNKPQMSRHDYAVRAAKIDGAADKIRQHYGMDADSRRQLITELESSLGKDSTFIALFSGSFDQRYEKWIPTDKEEFDRFMGIWAADAGTGRLSRDQLLDAYAAGSLRAEALLGSGDPKMMAFMAGGRAAAEITHQTPDERFESIHKRARTTLGTNIASYEENHNGARPPPGEIDLMVKFGTVYARPEGPRAPNADYTIEKREWSNPGGASGVTQYIDPRGATRQQQTDYRAEQSRADQVQRSQEAREQLQRDVNRGVQNADRAIQEGRQQIGGAVKGLLDGLDPKKKKQ